MRVVRLVLVMVAAGGLVPFGACGNPLTVSVVTLDVDGSVVVAPFEQEEFRVTAVNRGDERVVWGMGSSSCQLDFLVLGADGRRHDIDFFRGCTDDLGEQGLDPGESRTEAFPWDGTIVVDQEILVLPSGAYRLVGVAGERAQSRPFPVTVLNP